MVRVFCGPRFLGPLLHLEGASVLKVVEFSHIAVHVSGLELGFCSPQMDRCGSFPFRGDPDSTATNTLRMSFGETYINRYRPDTDMI